MQCREMEPLLHAVRDAVEAELCFHAPQQELLEAKDEAKEDGKTPLSTAFQRYPDLKMALSEGGIGWGPYLLERADFTNRHHRAWTHTSYGDKLPSEIFREHILTCFIEDDFGLANRHAIGIENICLEVDYPHSDCLWPDYPEGLWRSIQSVPGGIPDEEIELFSYQNMFREYRFDGIEKAGGREKCTVAALRELGANVDTSEVSLAGIAPRSYAPGKVVTSEDILAAMG